MTKRSKISDSRGLASGEAITSKQFTRIGFIRLAALGILVLLASSVLAQNPPPEAAKWDKAGQAARHKKDYATAIAYYERAIQLDPQFASAWIDLGIAYSDQHQYQKANAIFKKYLTLPNKPDEQAAWLMIGITDEELKQYTEAANAFRSLIRLDPEPGMMYKAHLELGKSLCFLKQYPDAAAELKEAIRLYPDDTEAREILPELEKALARTKNNQSATSGTSGQTPSPSSANAERCKQNVDAGKYAIAVDTCNQVVNANPREAAAWSNLGTAYFGLKRSRNETV